MVSATTACSRLRLLFKVLAIACALSLLVNVVDTVGATKFNDLGDEQQDAIIALLNDATFAEADPLALITEGLERLKKAKGEQNATTSGLPAATPVPNSGDGSEKPAASKTGTEAAHVGASGDDDDDDDNDDCLKSPSATCKLGMNDRDDDHHDGDNLEAAADETHSHIQMPDDDLLGHDQISGAPTMFHSSSHQHHKKIEHHIETDGPDGKHEAHYEEESGVPFKESSHPTIQPVEPIDPVEHVEHEDDFSFPSPPLAPSLPEERNFEDSYIDTSDPANPKHVHIENRNWSKVDPNGYAQERHESKTETSLNNPNSYSRHHSSSTSSSSTSYSRSSQRKNRTRSLRNRRWHNDHTSRARMSYPPAAMLPPLTMPMPYGLPVASSWAGYYPGAEYDGPAYGPAGLGYRPPAAASAYGAGAYGGYPALGLGDYAAPQTVQRVSRSKKSEKRRRRRANAAMRRRAVESMGHGI